MSSNELILHAYSMVVQERDKALVEKNNALAALETALSKVENLEEEIGTLRINARVTAMFEEYLSSPQADTFSRDHNTLKDLTRARVSSSESIKHVSAAAETIETSSSTHATPKVSTAVIRCSKCYNQGHKARDCRFNIPCEKCKRFGHSKSTCHVSTYFYCKICKVLGHTDDRCWFRKANHA